MNLSEIEIPNAENIWNKSIKEAYNFENNLNGIYSAGPNLVGNLKGGEINSRQGNNVYNLETNNIEKKKKSGNNKKSLKKESNQHGGIIEVLKEKYMNKIQSLKKQYHNMNSKEQKGGVVGGLAIFVAVIKIILMTLGTYMFDYFWCVFFISLMCVYIEYKLATVMGIDIIGLPLLYMLCAFCCPCCWTCIRLFKGWTNSLNMYTGNLFTILTNCSTATSILDIYNIDGKVCKDAACHLTRKPCYDVLFPIDSSPTK
jgi:hypothetical protein